MGDRVGIDNLVRRLRGGKSMPGRKKHEVPAVGKTFRHEYKGRGYVMKVVEHDGQPSYSVAGEVFRSPSRAARSVTGTAVNGWAFWGIERR